MNFQPNAKFYQSVKLTKHIVRLCRYLTMYFKLFGRIRYRNIRMIPVFFNRLNLVFGKGKLLRMICVDNSFKIVATYMLTDINECVLNTTICGSNEYCENNNGSYSCICQRGYDINENEECMWGKIPFA